MPVDINIYNTLTRKIEKFIPINEGKVSMYNCGPTVYDYAHIGNLRSFTMADAIRRAFEYMGYEVSQVMNITDVGHLVSDEDEGEDKMQKGAAREGKTVLEIAEKYISVFKHDVESMNMLEPMARPRATEYIAEQIEMIRTLVDGGFAYVTSTAVYFDVAKLPDYGKLTGQKLSEKKVGARDEVVVDPEKKNPADFRLWQLDQPNHILRWDSPWGEGFPGWHIECSAMSKAFLGEHFDIHTGGVDHIPVHHTNEIAQSEAANGEKYVNYWYHNEFLLVNDEKMSKSAGNFYTLGDLIEKGYSALDLRYFFLTAHFRQIQNFTLEALGASRTARLKLNRYVNEWRSALENGAETDTTESILSEWKDKFISAVAEDFNLPAALAVVWDLSKSNESAADKLATILDFDRVLGLRLGEDESLANVDNEDDLPEEALTLLEQRAQARSDKNWTLTDQLRDELLEKFQLKVQDTADGQRWEKVWQPNGD